MMQFKDSDVTKEQVGHELLAGLAWFFGIGFPYERDIYFGSGILRIANLKDKPQTKFLKFVI